MIQALPPPPPAVEAPAPERSSATQSELRVAAALTDARVSVDSSFSGASIVLYGAVFNPGDDPTDVVVVVRGPDAPVRLVKKTRNMGVWLNSRPVVFEGAPGFYMTASTRPLGDIADFGELRRLGVGVDHLRINAPEESRTVTRYGVRDVVISRLGEDYLDWRRAVIRVRRPPCTTPTPRASASSTAASSAPRSNCPPWPPPASISPRSGCSRTATPSRSPTSP